MEFLDVADENGQPTGEIISREAAHRKGIRHRTSHVWLVRTVPAAGRTELLLQKRADSKDSYPGCYDISSAGHIPAGEDFAGSALRELSEELGIRAEAKELVFCGLRSFRFSELFHGQPFHDNQVSAVYVLYRDTDAASIRFQKSEISAVCWTDFEEVVRMVRIGRPENCIRMEELEMIRKAISVPPAR